MNAGAARFRGHIAAGARLLLPFGLILAAYKLHSLWPAEWRGRVRVAEPHAWELAWFGVATPAGPVTPAAWWQSHLHPALDLVAGAAYLLFVPLFLGLVFWWRFGRGAPEARAERMATAQRAMWALLLLYVAGYVTYLIYPAAPPWYFERHGVSPLVPDAPPDAAGTLRFDALVGFPLFARYYGQSLNIFGAIPSLHCGTSFLGLLYALRLRSGWIVGAVQFVAVTFAAVYLNHHYLVDALVGMAYAAAAFAVAGGCRRRVSRG